MMLQLLYSLKRALRKLTKKLEEITGIKLWPYIIIIFAINCVILMQIMIFLAMNPQSTVCNAPTKSGFAWSSRDAKSVPTIHVITPTYARPVQVAELTRLAQTFMQVPNLHWLIVEDSTENTGLMKKFVKRLKTKFGFGAITLLNEPTPLEFKLKPGDPTWRHPKGSWQRNKALEWLREHHSSLGHKAVVYFADDDNTYDLELFDEMRNTTRVAVWPVGLVGGLLVERPLLLRDESMNMSRVVGFNAEWEPKRKFPIDMAGFAVNFRLLMDRPHAAFSCREKIGHMESHFLSQLVDSVDELEPRANDCKRRLVWHTKTRSPVLNLEKRLKRPSDADMEI